MNSSNPFVPQVSLLEQKNKTRARVKVYVLSIFAFNILLISPVLLIQACKREATTENADATATAANREMPVDTGYAVPPLTAPGSNVAGLTQPTPTPVPTPAATDVTRSTTEYVVVKGDTMDNIARSHKVTLAALKAANPDVVPEKLQIGHKLQIPAPTATAQTATASNDGTYVVKSGDTLSKIATNHGTTVPAIKTLNNLKTDAIKAGDRLKMPVTTSAASAPAAAPAMTSNNSVTQPGTIR